MLDLKVAVQNKVDGNICLSKSKLKITVVNENTDRKHWSLKLVNQQKMVGMRNNENRWW